ncbi:hypothetical protein U9M48_028296 [Paspalum notatum var. saurae]|uniref:Uncharacterized protein n=1 Tax=Paspalum notatum var. saurae TaxID=547442 RepID=A0AAQ3U105_PASNO
MDFLAGLSRRKCGSAARGGGFARRKLGVVQGNKQA